MPVRFEENGFSYDGFGGGYESWMETIITSDITGKELDEEDALYIEDVGYCTKEEVKGEKISLKERFAQYNGENLAKDFSWDEAKGKEIW